MLMQRLFGDAMPQRRIEMGTNETIKQAVMAEMGIALLSAHTIAAEVEAGRIAVLDVQGMPMVRRWYVVARQDKRLLPAARALWDHLVRDGAGFLPDAAQPVSAPRRSARPSGPAAPARRRRASTAA
jgi:LysR family transcriptional regulator for metE and metH